MHRARRVCALPASRWLTSALQTCASCLALFVPLACLSLRRLPQIQGNRSEIARPQHRANTPGSPRSTEWQNTHAAATPTFLQSIWSATPAAPCRHMGGSRAGQRRSRPSRPTGPAHASCVRAACGLCTELQQVGCPRRCARSAPRRDRVIAVQQGPGGSTPSGIHIPRAARA